MFKFPKADKDNDSSATNHLNMTKSSKIGKLRILSKKSSVCSVNPYSLRNLQHLDSNGMADYTKFKNDQLKQETVVNELQTYNDDLCREIDRLNLVIQELNSKLYVFEINEHNNQGLEQAFNEVALENEDLKKTLHEKENKLGELEYALHHLKNKSKEEAKSLTLKIDQLEKVEQENEAIKEKLRKMEQTLQEYEVYKSHSNELKIIKGWNESLNNELDRISKENRVLHSKLEQSQVEADAANKGAMHFRKQMMELEVEIKRQLDEAEQNERMYNYRLYNKNYEANKRIHSKSVLNINDHRNRMSETNDRIDREFYLNDVGGNNNNKKKRRQTSCRPRITISPIKRVSKKESKKSLYMQSSFRNKDLLLCYSNFRTSSKKHCSPYEKRTALRKSTMSKQAFKPNKTISFKEISERSIYKKKSNSINFNEANLKKGLNKSSTVSSACSLNSKRKVSAISNSKLSLRMRQSRTTNKRKTHVKTHSDEISSPFNLLKEDVESPYKKRNLDDYSEINQDKQLFGNNSISEERSGDDNKDFDNYIENEDDEENYDKVLDIEQQYEDEDYESMEEEEENVQNKSVLFLQDLNLGKDEKGVTSVLFNHENMTSEEYTKTFRDLLKKEKEVSRKHCVSVIMPNEAEEEDDKDVKEGKLGENVLDALNCETRYTPNDIKFYETLQKTLEELKGRVSTLEVEKYKLTRENELVKRHQEKLEETIKITSDEKNSYKVLLDEMQSNINELAEQKAKSNPMFFNVNGDVKAKSFLSSPNNYNNYNTASTAYDTNNTINVNNFSSNNFIVGGKFGLSKTIISRQISFSNISFLLSANENIFFKFNNLIKSIVNDEVPEKFKNTPENKLTINDLDSEEGYKVLLDLNKHLVKLNQGQGDEIDKLKKRIDKISRDFESEKDKLLLKIYKLSVDFQQLKVMCLNQSSEEEDEEDDEGTVTQNTNTNNNTNNNTNKTLLRNASQDNDEKKDKVKNIKQMSSIGGVNNIIPIKNPSTSIPNTHSNVNSNLFGIGELKERESLKNSSTETSQKFSMLFKQKTLNK